VFGCLLSFRAGRIGYGLDRVVFRRARRHGKPHNVGLRNRHHFQVAFFQTTLQRGARGQRRDLRAGYVILGAKTSELILDRLPAFAQMIELQRQINVTQPGQRQKRRYHNPARERRRIYSIAISSMRTVHLSLFGYAQFCAA